MSYSFPRPNLFCPAYSGWRLSYIPGSYSINCTYKKLEASSNFRAILRNKWATDARYRTADTRKPRGNSIVSMLRCLEVEFLSHSASCVAVSAICVAPFSNMFSTQADRYSRKLRLLVSLLCPRPNRFGTCSRAALHVLPFTHSFSSWISSYGKKKRGKAIPVSGREGPYGCETVRLPHFL
jgi:hypothetical protein